jgi:hypothetical protein
MLTCGLKASRDLFERLKRDGRLLDEEVTSDRFFNFVIAGYSLIDWVKHKPTVARSVSRASSPFASHRRILLRNRGASL